MEASQSLWSMSCPFDMSTSRSETSTVCKERSQRRVSCGFAPAGGYGARRARSSSCASFSLPALFGMFSTLFKRSLLPGSVRDELSLISPSATKFVGVESVRRAAAPTVWSRKAFARFLLPTSPTDYDLPEQASSVTETRYGGEAFIHILSAPVLAHLA